MGEIAYLSRFGFPAGLPADTLMPMAGVLETLAIGKVGAAALALSLVAGFTGATMLIGGSSSQAEAAGASTWIDSPLDRSVIKPGTVTVQAHTAAQNGAKSLSLEVDGAVVGTDNELERFGDLGYAQIPWQAALGTHTLVAISNEGSRSIAVRVTIADSGATPEAATAAPTVTELAASTGPGPDGTVVAAPTAAAPTTAPKAPGAPGSPGASLAPAPTPKPGITLPPVITIPTPPPVIITPPKITVPVFTPPVYPPVTIGTISANPNPVYNGNCGGNTMTIQVSAANATSVTMTWTQGLKSGPIELFYMAGRGYIGSLVAAGKLSIGTFTLKAVATDGRTSATTTGTFSATTCPIR